MPKGRMFQVSSLSAVASRRHVAAMAKHGGEGGCEIVEGPDTSCTFCIKQVKISYYLEHKGNKSKLLSALLNYGGNNA